MTITNQTGVERFRLKAFAKHGCRGWWKAEYATMSLNVLCQELRLRSEQHKCRELIKVVKLLEKNGF